MRPAHVLAVAMLAIPSRQAIAQAHHVTEQESNDAASTANRIAVGDSVSGVIRSVNDPDFFKLDLVAGTTLRILRTDGNVYYKLYDTDGRPVLWLMHPGVVADHPMEYFLR